MAMPDNGLGWHLRSVPPTSDEFVEAQKAYYLHTIECFGPNRCMFESNYPLDRLSISYHVLCNGFKKIVTEFSEDEKAVSKLRQQAGCFVMLTDVAKKQAGLRIYLFSRHLIYPGAWGFL
jgi:hypothetical protein